jgi:hypothetical protein
MTDIDKRTKIVFGGRRQGKSMVMKGLQMTIFKEAMRKAFQAGVSYEQTGRMSNREPQAPDFETFFADFERDIRNGQRSHAKHDTVAAYAASLFKQEKPFHPSDLPGYTGGAVDPVPVKNYGLQAAAAAYLSDPEQRVRDMVKADYADLGRPEPPVAMTTTATDADLPFKGLAEVEREIRAAFHVPPAMIGGRFAKGPTDEETKAWLLPKGCTHATVKFHDGKITCMTCERDLPGMPDGSTVLHVPPPVTTTEENSQAWRDLDPEERGVLISTLQERDDPRETCEECGQTGIPIVDHEGIEKCPWCRAIL